MNQKSFSTEFLQKSADKFSVYKTRTNLIFLPEIENKIWSIFMIIESRNGIKYKTVGWVNVCHVRLVLLFSLSFFAVISLVASRCCDFENEEDLLVLTLPAVHLFFTLALGMLLSYFYVYSTEFCWSFRSFFFWNNYLLPSKKHTRVPVSKSWPSG